MSFEKAKIRVLSEIQKYLAIVTEQAEKDEANLLIVRVRAAKTPSQLASALFAVKGRAVETYNDDEAGSDYGSDDSTPNSPRSDSPDLNDYDLTNKAPNLRSHFADELSDPNQKYQASRETAYTTMVKSVTGLNFLPNVRICVDNWKDILAGIDRKISRAFIESVELLQRQKKLTDEILTLLISHTCYTDALISIRSDAYNGMKFVDILDKVLGLDNKKSLINQNDTPKISTKIEDLVGNSEVENEKFHVNQSFTPDSPDSLDSLDSPASLVSPASPKVATLEVNSNIQNKKSSINLNITQSSNAPLPRAQADFESLMSNKLGITDADSPISHKEAQALYLSKCELRKNPKNLHRFKAPSPQILALDLAVPH